MYHIIRRDKGFTLIELLVAIAIIGILTSIVVGGISTARSSSRDKQRIASIEQIKLAVEIYREAYGRYPAAGCSRGGSWTGHGSAFGSCSKYIEGIDNIIKIPIDPISSTNGYIYRTTSTGSEFKIMAYGVVESEVVTAAHEYARYPTGCPGSMTGNNAITYAIASSGYTCN